MEYILFIYNNVNQPTTEQQWNDFFSAASESEIFVGGSEIAKGVQIGEKTLTPISEKVDGFMRFDTDDVRKIHKLLEIHPVLLQGGTVELCAMPKS